MVKRERAEGLAGPHLLPHVRLHLLDLVHVMPGMGRVSNLGVSDFSRSEDVEGRNEMARGGPVDRCGRAVRPPGRVIEECASTRSLSVAGLRAPGWPAPAD